MKIIVRGRRDRLPRNPVPPWVRFILLEAALEVVASVVIVTVFESGEIVESKLVELWLLEKL
jgi:hypothetical protein